MMASATRGDGLTQLQDQSPPPVADPGGRDNPEAYIPRDRRRALGAGVDLPDRVAGAALFADISGFTPLTEALAAELGPQRGAEELTINIGRVFHAVIEELDRRGGDVIYFSGDAITCWIDGDDGLLATAAALAMQEAIERVGRIVTPAGTTIQLGMKVAVAVGSARRFLVGDPDIQLIDVLAGRLIDDLAEAEHHAERGDIVLEASAVAALGERVLLRERRTGGDGSWVGVVDGLSVVAPLVDIVEPPALPEELVRPWLLPAVYERLQTGRGEFLAELRPAYPVFVRFGGIDYDEDDGAIRKLDEFVRRAQRILAGYGGNVLQLTLGDKGAYLYGVFGSPIAHEDDAARAAAAALEVRDLEATTSARDIQVGIGYGRLRSGTYGHAMRRTFVCLGDAVNLAARLMSRAPAGLIYVSDPVRQAAGDAFIWERLPDLALKGKSAPIAAHALGGSLERASRRRLRFELPLAGRTAELGLLDDRLAASLTGRGRIVAISSEAGMGKSRLLADLEGEAHRAGVRWTWVDNVSYATGEPYRFLRAFAQELANEQGTDSGSLVRTLLFTANVTPEIARRMAGAVAAVARDAAFSGWEAEAVLAPTDPDDVGEGVLEVARVYLRRLAEVLGPRVIVIDDLQWVDRSSLPAIEQLVRLTTELPFLVLIGTRSTGAAPWLDLPHVVVLRLDGLGPDETEELAAHVAGVAVQVDEAARLHERTGGNPLFIRELVRAQLDEVGSLRGGRLAIEASLDADRVPLTLRTVLGARIDALANADRATLHVASVVGMTFDASSLRRLSTERADRRTFDRLAHAGMLIAVDGVERWRFAHPLIREVAYAGLLASRRRALHAGIADLLEADTPSDLGPIAWHRAAAGDRERGVPMLVRAAEDAEALGALAEAAGYWEAAADLAVGDERALGWREHAAALQSDGREPARAGD